MFRFALFGVLLAASAFADPIYSVTYDNPVQVVGPNQTVDIWVTVTNTGPDSDFELVGQDMLGGLWANFYDVLNAPDPPITFLATGGTLNFLLMQLVPNPAPVPLGSYEIEYLALPFCDPDESCQGLGTETATTFQWTVADVPEPSSFALVGLGLAAVSFLRRRKAA